MASGETFVAPHDEQAERLVLGSVAVDNGLIAVVVDLLRVEDFYRLGHRLIFEAVLRLTADGSAVDLVTLRKELARAGKLEQAGGVAYLAGMTDGIPRAANVEHYAAIVVERALAREMLRRAQGIVADCLESGDAAEVILDRAEQAVFELAQRKRSRRGLAHINAASAEAIDYLERVQKGPLGGGVGYGLTDLDTETGGMPAGDLVILAARPSVGKSAFALHVALSAALAGRKVGFFSLEMSRAQLPLRLFSAVSSVDAWRLRGKFASEYEWAKVAEAAAKIGTLPVWIDDSAELGLIEMRARSRRAKAEHGLDLVIVDYLQLMRGPRAESRQQQVSEISRGLKALARDIDVPVLALSQLSREAEKRSDHRPQLSDLRESGALEQDADTVLLLYREGMHDKNAEPTVLEVIIAKQRNGPIGVVKAYFDVQTQRIDNLKDERR